MIHLTFLFFLSGYHQVGGPLTAERIQYTPKIKPCIIDAAQDLGYEFTDANGARQTGEGISI